MLEEKKNPYFASAVVKRHAFFFIVIKKIFGDEAATRSGFLRLTTDSRSFVFKFVWTDGDRQCGNAHFAWLGWDVNDSRFLGVVVAYSDGQRRDTLMLRIRLDTNDSRFAFTSRTTRLQTSFDCLESIIVSLLWFANSMIILK